MPERPGVERSASWRITPAGNAEFRRLAPTMVRLERGELLVELTESSSPKDPEPQSLLRIETPYGEATATGGRFYVAAHAPEVVAKETSVSPPLMRVLVLSGVVALTTPTGSVQGQSGDLLAAEPGKPPVELTVQANSHFAFDLYRQLADEHEGANLSFSPFSISSALAMTAEGARGQTAREMGAVLRFPETAMRVGDDAQSIPWRTALIHTGLGRLNQRFNREERPLQLHVANALWGEKTFPFREQLVTALSEPYGAALHAADFLGNYKAERLRINQWVEQQTAERIEELLPAGSLDPLTRLVLTNAIYFQGNWLQPFREAATREMKFTLADGERVPTLMMIHDPLSVQHKPGEKIDWPFGYVALDAGGTATQGRDRGGLQILEMPYVGRELSMFVFLPAKQDALPALEKQLSAEQLSQWLSKVRKQEVAVYMPKFTMETEFALKPTLTAMGMPTAFASGEADFTGLSDSPEARRLYLSAVQHKAFVEVNEKGTEAAGATAVIPKTEDDSSYPFFVATRPFVFLIRDNKTGTILFMGRMTDPTK
jgi:serpin B